MADTTYTLILNSAGAKTFTMPSGYWPDVEIHCWGAGGGTGYGGAPGGGGGYATTVVNVAPGDVFSLQIGQPGGNATGASSSGGAGGRDSSLQRFRGGNGGGRGYWCGQTDGPFPSGGGGGASWVAINSSPVCVGAGGGGGGGYGHGGYKQAGNPGGVFPAVASTVYPVTLSWAWNSFMNTYAVWGGGQDYTVVLDFPVSGTYTFNYSVDNYGSVYLDGSQIISYNQFSSTITYTQTVSAGLHTVRVTGVNTGGPAGVAAQILKPDSSELWNTRALVATTGLNTVPQGADASYGGGGGGGYLGGKSGYASGHAVTAGNGGLNYGSITQPGSGASGAGKAVAYYPGDRIGDAGYPGYIVLVLRKKLQFYIKNADGSGDWTPVTASYYKLPTQSVNVLESQSARTLTFNSVTTTTWTVPAGVSSINLTAIGGGGGGGGADSYPGAVGRAGARISGTLAVTPGQVLTLSVGAGGAGGSEGGSAPGGAGGVQNLGYTGGKGGTSGAYGVSGAGGGGGAASVVLVNNIPLVVAAGGGGGGGGGNHGPGQGVSPGGYTATKAGGNGITKSGDGGAGGGGGGGYPAGGVGGTVGGGDVGGYSGADGQSLIPSGFSLASASNGGLNSARGVRGAGSGGGGAISITYTPAPVMVTKVTGGWKRIQNIYIKVNGAWEPIDIVDNIRLYNL